MLLLDAEADVGASAWRFRLFGRPEDVPPGFCQPGYDDAGWDTVRARGLTGWPAVGTYCTNFVYPFPPDPPFVPPDNPTGCYRRVLTLPPGCAPAGAGGGGGAGGGPGHQRVSLVCEGVDSAPGSRV